MTEYQKDKRIIFSDLEIEVIKSITNKKPLQLLPPEIELIDQKYEDIFGRLDPYMDQPLFQNISDVLIMPALLHGAHMPGLDPIITKKIAVEYAFSAPETLSEEEYQKRRKVFDGTNYVMIRIYKEM